MTEKQATTGAIIANVCALAFLLIRAITRRKNEIKMLQIENEILTNEVHTLKEKLI